MRRGIIGSGTGLLGGIGQGTARMRARRAQEATPTTAMPAALTSRFASVSARAKAGPSGINGGPDDCITAGTQFARDLPPPLD